MNRFLILLLFCFSIIQDTSAQNKEKARGFLNELKGTWMMATDTSLHIQCTQLKGMHIECISNEGNRTYFSYDEVSEQFNGMILDNTGKSMVMNGYYADDRVVMEEMIKRDGRATGFRIIYIPVKGQLHCIEEVKYNYDTWQRNREYYLVRID